MRNDEVAINYPKLPDWEGTELNYRPSLAPEDQQRADVLWLLGMCVLGAVVATVAGRLLGLYLIHPVGIALMTSAGLLAGIFFGVVSKKWSVFYLFLLGGALAGPTIFLVSFTLWTRDALGWATLPLALGVVLLVDRIANHHMRWLLADPLAAPESVRVRGVLWSTRLRPAARRRWTKQVLATADDPKSWLSAVDRDRVRAALRDAPLLRWYPLALAAPLLFIPAVMVSSPVGIFVAFLLPIAAVGGWCVHARLRSDGAPRELLAYSVRVLCNWFRYGHGTPPAPGIFRSPSGMGARRVGLTVAMYGAFVLTLLPAARYLPEGYLALDESERLAAFRSAYDAWSSKPPGERSVAFELPRERTDNLLATDSQNSRAARYHIPAHYVVLHDMLVQEVPEAWARVAAHEIGKGRPGPWLVALVVSATACLIYPPLLVFAAIVGVTRTSLISAHRNIETAGGAERLLPPHDTPWTVYESRLRTSKHPVEREHLWIGSHMIQDYPILLHQDILSEHAYIVGDSGSGKTALGMLNLLPQIIRRRQAAVVIFDLKGDPALFQTIRREAADAGATFKFFTNELGRHTFAFNPFGQSDPTKLTLNQICETILEALNLNHGEGYGRSFYSRVARRWLHSILRQHPAVSSFEELYEHTEDSDSFKDDKERQDAFELIAVIESLASFEQINITPSRPDIPPAVAKNAISMPEVIAQKQVVYFWLPAAVEAATVREIAKLALYALLQAAYLHNRDKPHPDQTFLFIDEFQRIASSNFKIILEQARSMGVGAILANQTPGDLVTSDVDLRPTIQTNTRFKQCFSAADLAQQDDLMKGSGEAVYHQYSWTVSDAGRSTTKSQTVLPRLRRNDLLTVSDDPTASVFQVLRGGGFTQFGGFSLPVRSLYTMSLDRYRELRAEPWPSEMEGSFVTSRRALDPTEFINAAQRRRAVELFINEDAESRSSLVPSMDDGSRLDGAVADAEEPVVPTAEDDGQHARKPRKSKAKSSQPEGVAELKPSRPKRSKRYQQEDDEAPAASPPTPTDQADPNRHWFERVWATQDLINQKRDEILSS